MRSAIKIQYIHSTLKDAQINTNPHPRDDDLFDFDIKLKRYLDKTNA